jgi:hypothetical protein
MKLSLIRDELRRYQPAAPAAEKKPIVMGPTATGEGSTSYLCKMNTSISHYRCQAQWCDCYCHDVGVGGDRGHYID